MRFAQSCLTANAQTGVFHKARYGIEGLLSGLLTCILSELSSHPLKGSCYPSRFAGEKIETWRS